MGAFYRVLAAQPLTEGEIRAAGLFALGWFLMDAFWFFGTLMHWF